MALGNLSKTGYRKWRWETLREDLLVHTVLDPATGCHLWQGGTDQDGYPKIQIDLKDWRGNRAMLKAITGVLGPVARHSCDIPLCLEPSHLSWGTHADNRRDAVERGRAVYNARPQSRATNGRTKLSEVDVAAIKGARSGPSPVKVLDLARQYGVSRSAIQRALAS